MGRSWRDHPSWDVVQDASAVSERDIEHLLLEAGADELTETRNAQLATFVMGLVVLDAVERLGIEPTVCAGHSLGEYTALVAAGALGFEDAVKLVAERGDAMQEAAEENPGVMLALADIDDERARIACRRADGDVWLANSNAPDQCVIAGRPDEVGRAAGVAVELGAKVLGRLAVQGAFHTPLMAPAQPRLRKALEDSTFYPLAVPVVANVDALPHPAAEDWPALLSAQLRSPVRWRQTMLSLAAIMHAGEWDADTLFCELGPEGPLASMARATLPDASVMAIAEPDDLDQLVATLRGGALTVAAPEPAATRAPSGHQGERLYLSERIIVSPCAGIFDFAPAQVGAEVGTGTQEDVGARAAEGGSVALQTGRQVEIGDLVGLVSGTEVRSAFAGELMGVLAHPGERVQAGQPIAWLRAR